MDCRIIILNYNGRDLLEACLPSIVSAAAQSIASCRLTVLDNQSSDDSAEWLRTNFPAVEFVLSPSNRIFCSYNQVVLESKEEIVILLNNDIQVDPGFIDPLLKIFETKPDAFFSTPMVLNPRTGRVEGNLSKMEFRWGLLWGSAQFAGFESLIHAPSFSMQCGFGAFRRDRFVELGGFDDLYLPGTVEDADLCFRGYRRGWKGYYCPDSRVFHMGQVSFKRAFGASRIRRFNRRNLYLFVWKNIRSKSLLAVHFIFIPLQLARYFLRGQWAFVAGFWDAIFLFPKAIRKRNQHRSEASLVSDERIFEYSRSIGSPASAAAESRGKPVL